MASASRWHSTGATTERRAYFAHRALDKGMIGISMTSGGVSGVPTGGAEPLLGLNPIAIAAPADEEVPFIFDAAMSSVAGNKIQLLRRIGGNMAPGWVALGGRHTGHGRGARTG